MTNRTLIRKSIRNFSFILRDYIYSDINSDIIIVPVYSPSTQLMDFKNSPEVFDEFEQAKKEKQDAMEALKKRFIRNGLPIDEMVELGQRYKAEIKAMVDKILEQYNR